jgi:hypothetical protein
MQRTDLERPQNVGESITWGFFGIGAAIAAGQRSSLSGSISSNESKLGHERALQTSHQTRYNDAFARIEKANLTLIDLRGHKTSISNHIKSLKSVLASSEKAMEFLVGRKNMLNRIHTDLVNMTRFATSYAAHRYDEQASARFLAEGIVDIFDVTPDWPGTTVPVVLAVMLLRWAPSLIDADDLDVLGEDGRGDEDSKNKVNRVVQKASQNFLKSAETVYPVPRLDQYLRDIEFDWEKTFRDWHRLIEQAKDTSLKPAPVVLQW